MFKILNELGAMKGHDAIKIYNLEELGLVAVNFDRADGTNMEAWKCDESGYAINQGEPSMTFRSISEPISYDDETKEPDQWTMVGFELN